MGKNPYEEIERLFDMVFTGRGIGFEPLYNNMRTIKNSSFPPHNIVQVTDDKYVVSLAVAGFSEDNINVTREKDILTVKGELPEDNLNYVHQGIAGRKFTKSFVLGEHMEIEGAGMKDGMLHIALVRNVPEEQKPKQIPLMKEKEVGKLLEKHE